jgi:hypothetical protein
MEASVNQSSPRAPRLRRVIIGLVAGLALLDLGVLATRDVWRRHDPDDYRERLLACRAGAWDCVLVGGSPVSEGVDPALLEGLCWRGEPLAKVFNLGLPGGSTTDVWHAAAHGITERPRLLVYGITASDINDTRRNDKGPRRLVAAADLVPWWRLRPANGWFCTRNYLRGQISQAWSLYEHRHGLRLWLARQWPDLAPEAAAQAEHKLRTSAAIVANGYAPFEGWRTSRLDLIYQRGHRPPAFDFLSNFQMGGHLRYLERLIDWAEEGGTALVLVDMPVSAELEQKRHAAIFSQYRAALAELARRRRVPVIDGSRGAVGLTDEHFCDLIHLNVWGTRRFTTWLRGQLAGPLEATAWAGLAPPEDGATKGGGP